MPQVSLREKDSLEVALRKLKRLCEKAGIWAAVRSKTFYEKPTTARKRKGQQAEKREKKKTAVEKRELKRTARRLSYYHHVNHTAND